MNLSKFKVLIFDCYRKLIDWETGIASGLKPLISNVRSASITIAAQPLFP